MIKLGLYQHYSGKLYQVLGIGRHSETLEEMVVYRKLYDDYSIWLRPKAMFEEAIQHKGKILPRFQFIKALDTEAPALR